MRWGRAEHPDGRISSPAALCGRRRFGATVSAPETFWFLICTLSLSLARAVGRMTLQVVPVAHQSVVVLVVGLVVQEAIEDVPHYMGSVAKVKSMAAVQAAGETCDPLKHEHGVRITVLVNPLAPLLHGSRIGAPFRVSAHGGVWKKAPWDSALF